MNELFVGKIRILLRVRCRRWITMLTQSKREMSGF